MEVIQLSFWSKLIIRYPKWVILLVVLLTATFLYGCTLIKVNTDITSSIPENLPVKQFYNQVGELFPNQDFFIIGIQHDDKILNPSSLEKIQNLTESLFQLPEVDDVLNILNAQIVTGENDTLVIRSVLENPLTGEEKLPTNRVEILDFQKKLNKSEMGDGLISEDKKASIILVSLLDGYKNMGSDQGNLSLEEKINQVVSAFKGPEKIYFSGQPVVSDLLGRYMSRDFMLLFPLSILVVLLIFFFSFRSLRGVLLPVAVVILGVIWTMGTTGFLNIPFSMSTLILPMLLIAVGSAYGIHVVNRYYVEAAKEKLIDRPTIIQNCLNEVGVPVFLAGITTMAGFASMATSRIIATREMGFVTAYGVGLSLLLSLSLIPAILLLLPLPRKRKTNPVKNQKKRNASLFIETFQWLAVQIIRKRKLIVITFSILTVIALIGITRLTYETNPINNFKSDNPIVKADHFLNEKFDGTTPMQIVVDSGKVNGIKNPEVLKHMDQLQNYLTTLPEVGAVQSIVSYVKTLNRAWNQGDQEYYNIPESQQVIDGLFFMYIMSGGEVDQSVDFDYQRANMVAFLKSGSTKDLRKVNQSLNQYVSQNIPKDIEIRATGPSILTLTVGDLLVEGQIKNIITSILLVLIIISLAFRSLAQGVLGMLPLTIASLWNFGLMGWLKIPLDIGTVMISSIAIGIGVDYTVHFISRYQSELILVQGDFQKATIGTLNAVGKPVFYNALGVAAGFMVLAFSTFRGVNNTGYLTALIMATSSICALTFLPAFIMVFQPKALLKKINIKNKI